MMTCAIIGYGPRGECVFGKYLRLQPDVKIVAVAEKNSAPRDRAKAAFQLKDEECFETAEQFFARPKLCDAVVISTDDATHAKYAKMAAKAGYHILLEKPISKDLNTCLDLAQTIREQKVLTTVCHELRYGAVYSTIKKLVDSGVIGKPVHISQTENVCYWHIAHSFVRGVWNREEKSSPMILAKCCHDTDLILWLMEGETPKYVSSFGSRLFFREENAPEGAPEYCMDHCPHQKDCPYDAGKYYLREGIPADAPDYVKNAPNLCFTITKEEPTPENLRKALRNGPYGKCVFHSDNDVVDHQTVNIEFESGATANLIMSGFTARQGRRTQIMGTLGEILYCETEDDKIRLRIFGKSDEEILPHKQDTELLYGHDEADVRLIERFVKDVQRVQNGETVQMDSAIELSIQGHVLAILAEQSRLAHGRVMDMESWKAGKQEKK